MKSPFPQVHARPSVGVFQKSILDKFVNFWRHFPTKWLQKPSPNPKTVPWDTPTKGLLWKGVLPTEIRVESGRPKAKAEPLLTQVKLETLCNHTQDLAALAIHFRGSK